MVKLSDRVVSGKRQWCPITTPVSELLRTKPEFVHYRHLHNSVSSWADVFDSFCTFMWLRNETMFLSMLAAIDFDFIYKQDAQHTYANDENYRCVVGDWFYRSQLITDEELIRQTLRLTEMFDLITGSSLTSVIDIYVQYI